MSLDFYIAIHKHLPFNIVCEIYRVVEQIDRVFTINNLFIID